MCPLRRGNIGRAKLTAQRVRYWASALPRPPVGGARRELNVANSSSGCPASASAQGSVELSTRGSSSVPPLSTRSGLVGSPGELFRPAVRRYRLDHSPAHSGSSPFPPPDLLAGEQPGAAARGSNVRAAVSIPRATSVRPIGGRTLAVASGGTHDHRGRRATDTGACPVPDGCSSGATPARAQRPRR